MRNVVLYIGMSLDGFIADENESVNWLVGDNPNDESSDNYEKFSETIDTVILGHKTYSQISTELSVDNWPYENMTSYIITHNKGVNKESIFFYDEDIVSLIDDLKEKDGKDIWICGGASIVNQLVKENKIDEYRISIIPTILGKGTKLFKDDNLKVDLKLKSTEIFNGIIELIYTKKENHI